MASFKNANELIQHARALRSSGYYVIRADGDEPVIVGPYDWRERGDIENAYPFADSIDGPMLLEQAQRIAKRASK